MIIAGTTVCVLIAWFLLSRKRKGSDARKRSMSFNSQVMIQGSFPPEATVAPPIIDTLFLFNTVPKEEDVKEACKKFIEIYRFRSVPEFSPESNSWEFREVDVNLDDHVISTTVSSEQEALDLCEKLSKEPLTGLEGKPVWVFHRIENTGKGISVLFLRLHHVIGDGISCVLAMNRLFTDKDGKSIVVGLPGDKHNANVVKSKPSFFTQAYQVFQSAIRVATLGMSKYDSDIYFNSPNKRNLSMTAHTQKHVFFPTLRLAFVKALKNGAKATVNDVMLASTTGAIRRYCEKMGDPAFKHSTANLQFRALLPYAFPRPEKEATDPFRCMRNKWSFVSVPMPINDTSPKQRLESCVQTMNRAKKSPDAFVQLWLQNNILSLAPTFLVRKTCIDTFSRQSVVFSNVPGPQEAAYFAKQRIIGIQSLFPNIITQCLIVSYDGSVFMNMVVDGEVVKDIELLKQCFLEEVTDMAEVYGVSTADMMAPLSPGGTMGIAANSATS